MQRDLVKEISLFTLEDIPSGHFFLLEDAVWNLKLDAREWKALNKFIADFPDAKMYSDLRDFFLGEYHIFYDMIYDCVYICIYQLIFAF